MPADRGADPPLLRVVGPNGVCDVWLGATAEGSTLEAEVRDVCTQDLKPIAALATALGEVARRHTLEVRVIPRTTADGPSLLVLFGRRTYRAR